ncbi:MAG: hypothetical protein ACYDH1_02190 [Anaerolineaceae bacterium]
MIDLTIRRVKGKEEKMNTNNYQKVHSVNSELQAFSMQADLENAGIPAVFSNSKGSHFIDVFVPAEYAEVVNDLLNPEPCFTEFFTNFQA